jgi:hypothetical protein
MLLDNINNKRSSQEKPELRTSKQVFEAPLPEHTINTDPDLEHTNRDKERLINSEVMTI